MSSIFRKAARMRVKEQASHQKLRLRQEGFKLVKTYKKGKPVITKVPIVKPIRRRSYE